METKNAFGDKAEIIPDFQLSTFAKRGYRVTLQYKGSLMAFELSFLPDALLLYKETAYFIEWDRATLMGVNLFKKVSAYQQYFLEEPKMTFDVKKYSQVKVVFICPSETRVRSIIQFCNDYTTLTNIRVVLDSDWLFNLSKTTLYFFNKGRNFEIILDCKC